MSRVRHRDALFQQLAAAFQQRPTEAWLSTLEAVDILCAPIAGYAEVTSSLQYRGSGVETGAAMKRERQSGPNLAL